jgi:hypothetical protein
MSCFEKIARQKADELKSQGLKMSKAISYHFVHLIRPGKLNEHPTSKSASQVVRTTPTEKRNIKASAPFHMIILANVN